VLVVDDEPFVRGATKALLETSGFDVLTADDGQEAVDVFLAHRDRIACVVLDLTMPKMGGEEVFQELFRLDPHVRVILTSGYPAEEVMERFAGQTVFGAIQKPAPMEVLIAKVREAIATRTSKSPLPLAANGKKGEGYHPGTKEGPY
jgi:DNA-binding NtrC family response regulator